MGLLPLAALRWLPRGRPGPRPGGGPAAGGGGAIRQLVFAACTVAAGVVDSFLPLARGVPSGTASTALLVQSIAATLSRWQAGREGDRIGHARLLVPAVIAAALGMGAAARGSGERALEPRLRRRVRRRPGDVRPVQRPNRLPAGFALTGLLVLAAVPAARRERTAPGLRA